MSLSKLSSAIFIFPILHLYSSDIAWDFKEAFT